MKRKDCMDVDHYKFIRRNADDIYTKFFEIQTFIGRIGWT